MLPAFFLPLIEKLILLQKVLKCDSTNGNFMT